MFSIEPKQHQGRVLDGMLKDPFFSFLGAKRKELPPASSRVGMDAGLDPKPTQTTHYFAAIWDADRETQRNTDTTAGYLLTPDSTGKASARLYLGPKQAESLVQFHAPGNPAEGEMFKQVVDFGFFGLVAKLLFVILRGHPFGRAQLGLGHRPPHRGHPRRAVAPEHQDHHPDAAHEGTGALPEGAPGQVRRSSATT